MRFLRSATFAVVIFAWGTASAHTFEHPKILRVGIRPERIVIAMNFDVNPGAESLRTRALFDRNADGELDPQEQTTLQDYLVKTALLWLKVQLDEATLSLADATVKRYRLDRSADDASAIGIALLLEVPITGDAHVLSIADRDRDKQKHVPVTVDLAPGCRVDLATQGEFDPEPNQVIGIRLAAGRDLAMRIVCEP